jgi:hypothetical protein
VKRREFITLIGGAAAAWPLAARAQQAERMRRIAVLQGGGDRDDPRSQRNIAAFLQALQQLGWTDGRNVRIEYRWPAGDADKARKYAAELRYRLYAVHTDCSAGGPAQAAGGLLGTLLRRRRRPDLLWA